MIEYHLKPPTILPSLAVKVAKEKRRKVLEKAWQTRRENYLQFLRKKRQLHASDDLATIAQLMLTKDDLKAIVDAVSPLIDARARTTEILVKGEVRSVKDELKSEILASEERTKEELRAEILAARAEAKADSLALGAKIVKRENEQDKRLDALENEAGLSNPNKN